LIIKTILYVLGFIAFLAVSFYMIDTAQEKHKRKLLEMKESIDR